MNKAHFLFKLMSNRSGDCIQNGSPTLLRVIESMAVIAGSVMGDALIKCMDED